MAVSKIDQIRSLLKSIETGDLKPVAVVNEEKYIQHNPQTHEGSEGLATLFKRLSKTAPRVNMVRGFEDGDYVFAQMEYDFSSRKICFEVFRFEDGQAVEHWDNIQERLGPNLSGHGMVDGHVEVTDRECTEDNRRHVQSFIETVLIEGELDRLYEFVDEPSYVEHNPYMSDDLSMLKQSVQENRQTDYQILHRVLAEGNFVLSVTEGYSSGKHTAFYDLFRLENGRIVEHWDTTEHVAPKEEWKNDNGKF